MRLVMPKGRKEPKKGDDVEKWQKLQAYKRHWNAVSDVADEFNKQFIHEGLSIGEVASDSRISWTTVRRFLHLGGPKGYSYYHGPHVTTVFGIAEALDLKFQLVPKGGPPRRQKARKKRNGKT